MAKFERGTSVVLNSVRFYNRTYSSLTSPNFLRISNKNKKLPRFTNNETGKWFCTSCKEENYANLIQKHTKLSRDHMTPEIALHLITKECPLWSSKGENSPFIDPFWAFYWPGGQVLTRYILDNPDDFYGQSVVDIGSGCGASAIAACMVGASHVTANDIDPVSIEAIKMNAKENSITLDTDCSNLIGQMNNKWNTLLIGDMFYEEAFRDKLVNWLKRVKKTHATNVFIGDPGRLPLLNHPIKSILMKCATYDLPEVCREENSGMTTGFVWKLDM